MALKLVEKDESYYFNQCAKHLARGPANAQGAANLSAISEAWRFPIIDTGPSEGTNCVSFVYDIERSPVKGAPSVVGTFHALFEPIPLRRLRFLGQDSAYFAITAVVPTREIHRYKFKIDNQLVLDPINPQRVNLDDGSEWSRFFTDETLRPVTFESWQLRLMYRLTERMLPFRTKEAKALISTIYEQSSSSDDGDLYRLDDSVGELNYIDKILARQERHHLTDYQICLREIDRVLRVRNPYMDPENMPASMYTALLTQMGDTRTLPDWDYGKYDNPRYFLDMLRRHVVTGAFCHPKHGGNVGAAGWAYLAETYRDANGNTLFAWEDGVEQPLGTNQDYRG